LPWAGLLRPYGANSNTAPDTSLHQGVALGWFV